MGFRRWKLSYRKKCQPCLCNGQYLYSNSHRCQWMYSNTGYILLGMVLEAAGGQSYADLLQDRIFSPLEMNNTELLEGVPYVNSIVDGYFVFPYDINTTEWNGTQGWAAGAIISTATDAKPSRTVEASIVAWGRLESAQPVVLLAEGEGVLEAGDIPFQQGQSFRKGDLLLRVDDRHRQPKSASWNAVRRIAGQSC